MTNLIASLVLTLATNWTETFVTNRDGSVEEIGIVSTNLFKVGRPVIFSESLSLTNDWPLRLPASLDFILITNWTGHVAPDGKEVGYLVTNHVATIEYRHTTNQLCLLSVPSNIAVYRPKQYSCDFGTLTLTNIVDPGYPRWWFNAPGIVLTNIVVTNAF